MVSLDLRAGLGSSPARRRLRPGETPRKEIRHGSAAALPRVLPADPDFRHPPARAADQPAAALSDYFPPPEEQGGWRTLLPAEGRARRFAEGADSRGRRG